MKKVILAFIFSLFLITNALAQTLTTTVNRNKVPLGQTFVATVEYTGNAPSQQPDFSALNKEFEIYGIATGFQSTNINGSIQNSHQWKITLLPKKAGRFVIPSFSIGGIQSNTVEIEASKDIPGGSKAEKTEATFSVSSEIHNKTPFVQQQTDYIVTLHDSGGLQGAAPQVIGDGNDWIVRNLRQREIETQVINGKNVRTIKFHYALFPQRSGQINLPIIQFDGYYLDGSGGEPHPLEEVFGGSIMLTGFENAFGRRIPIKLQTEPETINVQPAVSKGWWLPAEQLELFSEWEKEPDLKVGDTLNRTVYIQASGVLEGQLPDLTFKSGEGFKQYPEKAETRAMIKDDKVIAIKQFSNVYVLSKSGEVTFPEISLEWFNVNTKQMEKATLPEVKITVAEGEPAPFDMPKQNVGEAAMPVLAPTPVSVPNVVSTPASVSASAPVSKHSESMLLLYITIAFLLGIVLSYFLFGAKPHSLKKAVIDAAKRNDFRALQENLVRWAGGSNFQDVIRLAQNKEFETELDKLSTFLYSRDKREDWNAASFIKAFKKVSRKKPGGTASNDPLPPLY